MAEFRMREHTDPQALRALAHPLRMKLLQELALRGPATATELAERVGDTAPNCSWHLRQLAKYGYVEDAPGGQGRQRPWRFVPAGNRWGTPGEAPEITAAGDAVSEVMLQYELAELQSWQERRSKHDANWRAAAFLNQSITWLTPEELDEIGAQIQDLLLRHLDRLADPELRPENARPVRMIAWGIPAEH
ncbi:helix-turn-helix domain-containing protein [Hamadaea sp. NPDC051192]|uniref:winged helix-turn-helix domain-containing protein n=1 Tax=Hamadaea sp. NPDC051192 TaxID=3154940 RepID=UPI0034263AFF